ncbi:MAG: aminotransferase class III-fold pyridoxal phosphate-dependent enzyme [Beijerinckiaceae bacterium]|nr:aminotransferase class III-fold pyridoxal phosphate-dependent enzyme [Beijerinckiaceae bacterium]
MTFADADAPGRNRDDAFWMPFTAMRQYRRKPMNFVSADAMHYETDDGRRILDGMAGLWCVNAGHGQPRITQSIRDMAGQLDFVSSFRMSHPGAAAMAQALTALAPVGLDHAFFVSSGSEAVDSALKIARAYHQARGEGRRVKLIGRAKGYHGMGWGGLSVSGIGRHKRDFGPLLGEVAHLPLPYDATMAFSDGQPRHGADYAQALEQIVAVNDAGTIAAVIVEPVTGSGGVYPPPHGYLDALRAICDRHGILLIFDEVITGFGRLGASFAAQAYGVLPDLLTCAKGMTNGAVPMGAVLARDTVFDAFMAGPPDAIELLHGYTYSAHPLACAAGLATIAVHDEFGLNARAARLEPLWRQTARGLRDAPHVADIRTAGILAGIDLTPRSGASGARGNDCAQACFEAGMLIRNAGDTLLLSPPLVLDKADIERLFKTIHDILNRLD